MTSVQASPYSTKISGTGSYLPEKLLTNHDLEKMVDTNDAWISERTGIKERHLAAPEQVTTDLALIAARKALEAAQVTPSDIDLIIFATQTADQPMPTAACVLQAKLGCRTIPAFDIAAACSGFIYASSIADQFIRTGMYKHILVIGAEVLSRVVNYQDRETCILFGDGAGAVVYSRSEGQDKDQSKIYSSHLRADGQLGELFTLPAGGSKMPFSQAVLNSKAQYMTMKGREVFKNAVRTMSQVCQEALDANGMQIEQIDWLIPHQANLRIIDAVGLHFGIDPKHVIVNVQRTGNTSAATVPIAMDEAIRDGRIQRGQNVLLTAFGAGLTSGSLLMRY